MNKLRNANPWLEMCAIFAGALLIRVAFNLSLEARLCHFGDAFYFLTSGAQLLGAVQSGMLTNLSALHPQAAAGVQAMTSLSFVDRILIDGPVFPGYLATLQFFLGMNPAAPHFDAHSMQFATSNSLLDSAACVLIYQIGKQAFDRMTGRIAGIAAAFYPAAIINTASCYSEPFGYFLVALFLVTFFNGRHPFLIGLSSAFLMLSKPVLIALPPAIFALSFLLGARPGKDKIGAVKNITICLAAMFIVFAPWLVFTGAVTGKSTLMVNRYPTLNFIVGNRLVSDGWREYPLPYVPVEMPAALKVVAIDFQHAPVEYTAMQLRKVSRLWAGAWNNFDMTFVLPPAWQDRVHQLLLFAAFFGVVIALSRNSIRSEVGRGTLILAAVPLFHCIYIAFEPQSRYAFPAMPAVLVLAAYALSNLWRNDSFKLSRLSTATVALGALTVVLCFTADAFFRPERFERMIIAPTVTRTIQLPQSEIRDGYVIVDVKSIADTSVTVNGRALPEPLPYWQIAKTARELMGALAVQSAGMGKPLPEFRQWWAFPVDAELLKEGSNTVQVSSSTVYGDTAQAYNGNSVWLPSLTKAAWTKGFASISKGDTRIFERISISPDVKPSAIMPRIFFVPAAENRSDTPIKTVQLGDKSVMGANPLSYSLAAQPVPVADAPERFRFSADVQSAKGRTNGYVSLIFSATVGGTQTQWSSPWQPSALAAHKTPSRWVISDKIPTEIAQAPDAAVTLIASPFVADLLFLNKKQAVKRAILVRNARLEFIPAGAYPAPAATFALH